MTIELTRSRVARHLFQGGLIATKTALLFFLIILLWVAAILSLAGGPTGAPWLAWVYVLAVPAGPVALLWVIRRFADQQRERIRKVGLDMKSPARKPSVGVWRVIDPWRTGSTWRHVGFHLYAIAVDLPGSVLLVAPGAGAGLARLDVRVGRVLLGQNRKERILTELESVSRSRREIIAATDAERRRIERDLHDGVQQRLVSLAMNLGMARAALPPSPEREAIEEAHEEAVAAMAELRNFVRGLHPAVLDDRGLDAALSGIAARAPFPVRLEVDVEPRCNPSVEAIAYFTVSEALANVAKHSGAESVSVIVRRDGRTLTIEVSDDGKGGAIVRPGNGLGGLDQRARAADGKMTVRSLIGGGTRLIMELPCA